MPAVVLARLLERGAGLDGGHSSLGTHVGRLAFAGNAAAACGPTRVAARRLSGSPLAAGRVSGTVSRPGRRGGPARSAQRARGSRPDAGRLHPRAGIVLGEPHVAPETE